MKFYKIYFLVCIFLMINQLHAKKYEYNGPCVFKGYTKIFEQCLDQELMMYDEKLNDLYKSLFQQVPNKHLKKAELLWIKFKEADCEYMAYEVNEGKEFQSIYKACLINKTKTRIVDLKRSYFYHGWFKDELLPE